MIVAIIADYSFISDKRQKINILNRYIQAVVKGLDGDSCKFLRYQIASDTEWSLCRDCQAEVLSSIPGIFEWPTLIS